MPPVGFEPTIPASARPQTYALDLYVKQFDKYILEFTSAWNLILYGKLYKTGKSSLRKNDNLNVEHVFSFVVKFKGRRQKKNPWNGVWKFKSSSMLCHVKYKQLSKFRWRIMPAYSGSRRQLGRFSRRHNNQGFLNIHQRCCEDPKSRNWVSFPYTWVVSRPEIWARQS
jgi:hypothetical protein